MPRRSATRRPRRSARCMACPSRSRTSPTPRGLRPPTDLLLFRDHVPAEDDLVVARLRRAGAIILGKTNTPEFGFGAVCTNKLCGPTRNPFDPALTSGGSSGGSAVAVAAGMVPLAHGTDFGGSVRTPASFCDVASIRPTPGRIPSPRRPLGWDMLATHGFLARGVDDLELALSVCAGGDAHDPLSTGVVNDDRPLAGRPPDRRHARFRCRAGCARCPCALCRALARRSRALPMSCRPRPIAAARSRPSARCAPRTSPTAMASC